jgi:hypothetical protein
MAQISAVAEQEIKTLLVNWWTAVNTQLAAVTGASVQIGQAPVELLFNSEIGQRLVRIAEVNDAIAAAEAAQKPYPWCEERAQQILKDCEQVEAWLNQGAVSHKTPDAFWTSPVGFMILRAKVWANQDQLITLSAAAEISGMSLSVLSQRMTRGQLPGYRDPNVRNPKHGRRVRLSDLHILLHETGAHIPYSAASPQVPQAHPAPIQSSSRPT